MNGDISSAFPKAVALNDWLTKQNALTSGKLPIYDARHNIDGVKKAADNITPLGWHTNASRSYMAEMRKGVKQALTTRDETFGDYRTAEGKPAAG